jgi:hypothetical protein
MTTSEQRLSTLERDGIVLLPDLFDPSELLEMQLAFHSRLRRLRWNNVDGYEKTERYRHMVQDVLTLEQGFVHAAVHPAVKELLNAYLEHKYALVEAKGWRSLPTRRNFHGWHGDAWFDPQRVAGIPREVKLAIYLTDVKSGAFNYIKGTHRKELPPNFSPDRAKDLPTSQIVEVAGRAGTAFLFDTSGIHRQSYPILEPRDAVFYCYHDPAIPLQKEDVEYYRYHPLLLNAAFLGDLTGEDRRILGFGDKTNCVPAFERDHEHPRLESINQKLLAAALFGSEYCQRLLQRSKRFLTPHRS